MARLCEYGTEPTDCRVELTDCQIHKAPLYEQLLVYWASYQITAVGLLTSEYYLHQREKREKSGNLSDVGKHWTEKCFRLAFSLVFKCKQLRYHFRRQELKCIPEHKNVIKVFYLPTDAKVNCLKSNFKVYIKTAPTCFGSITVIRERTIRAC